MGLVETHGTQTRKRRIPFDGKVLVKPRDGNPPTKEQIHDLSMGGLFIKCMLPLPPGSIVDLLIPLDSYQLRAPAKVLWTRPVEKGEDAPSGMAVEFLELTLAQRKLLHLHIDQYLRGGGTLNLGTPPAPGEEAARQSQRGEGGPRLSQAQVWLIVGITAVLLAAIVLISVL